MGDDIRKIKYNYHSERFSPKAVDHAFRYIAVLTGVEFVNDEKLPVIIKRDDIPQSGGRLVVRNYNDSENSGFTVLEDDSIETILKALAISPKLGPHNNADMSDRELSTPLLSAAISKISKALSESNQTRRRRRHISIWPDERRFGAVISHDIDIAERSIAGGLRLLFKSWPAGRFKGLADTLRWRAGGGANPYHCISEWLEMENKLEVISTFFVFAGKRHHPDDPKYNPGRLSDTLKSVVDRGFEIALHSGIESFDGRYLDESKNALETIIGSEIRGIRPHYLSARFPKYWRKAAENGLEYSSALGFDDTIGFYAGIDLPILPYDRENDCPLDIVEIPLTIMDCGLIGNAPADLIKQRNDAFRMIDTAEESGSLIVFDWHQRTLYNTDYPGWRRLFYEIIEYLVQKRPHIDTMSGIVDLFQTGTRVKS